MDVDIKTQEGREVVRKIIADSFKDMEFDWSAAMGGFVSGALIFKDEETQYKAGISHINGHEANRIIFGYTLLPGLLDLIDTLQNEIGSMQDTLDSLQDEIDEIAYNDPWLAP